MNILTSIKNLFATSQSGALANLSQRSQSAVDVMEMPRTPVNSPMQTRRATDPTSFQHRTSFSVVPKSFPDFTDGNLIEGLMQITPRAPKGDDWRLVNSSTLRNAKDETVVLFFWERPWIPGPKLGLQ